MILAIHGDGKVDARMKRLIDSKIGRQLKRKIELFRGPV